ncbi:MAG: bifunctional nuclease family protein [Actinobacteria bacterium]|nr:bifunctional nuclease family protein [Actinomycetota bacterium]
MVQMELLGVRLELPANAPVVLLRESKGSRRVLPIYIGPEEAKAIALALDRVTTPRPMTHDLMRDLLGALGASVQRIVLTELRDSTFFAEIEMVLGGRVHRVSSRPSDAIALAVRVDASIFATDEVLDDAAAPASEEPEEQDQIVDEFRQFIENVSPEDFGPGS